MKNNVSNFIINAKAVKILILLIVFSFSDILAQDSISVMSFNIRYGLANDGENSWQFRNKFVFDVIKTNNPDLIGLQEALFFQVEEILNQFPGYKMIGVGRDDGKLAGELSCILYKSDKFSVDTSSTFWFSDTPEIPGSRHWGNNYNRICTWGKFQLKNSDKSFYYYNLHLDHESEIAREKSVDLLIQKIGDLKKANPIIISGDFNCGESSVPIQIILKEFRDTFRLVNSKQENEGTFNGFTGDISGERIDYILINNLFETKKAEIIRTNYEGKFPSDHFPISSQIILK